MKEFKTAAEYFILTFLMKYLKEVLFALFVFNNEKNLSISQSVKYLHNKIFLTFTSTNSRYSVICLTYMTQIGFLPSQTRYRSQFKKAVTQQRANTTLQSYHSQPYQSLSQISQRFKQTQETKKIHNLPKQTYITSKKEFLLSRKMFYVMKNKEKTSEQTQDNKIKNNKTLNQDVTTLKELQSTPVFQIQKEVMKNPFSFHRKMIFQIRDDKGVKGILNQWYKDNVEQKIQKLHQQQAFNRQKSLSYKKNRSFTSKKQKISAKNKGNLDLSKCKQYQSTEIRINEEKLSKNSIVQSDQLEKKLNSERLAKIMVRVQPFWYKIRLKI